MAKSNVSDIFLKTIREYLESRAAGDAQFARAYANKDKNVEECCNYIVGEVRKSGRCGFTDAEIYGMAVHYYDESDIKDVEPLKAKVVVNRASGPETVSRQRDDRERRHGEARRAKSRAGAESEETRQLSLFDM